MSNAPKARQRTYTTVGTTNFIPPHLRDGAPGAAPAGGTAAPAGAGGAPQNGAAAEAPKVVRTHGVHPPPPPGPDAKCTCDPLYVKRTFFGGAMPGLDFHERFHACKQCGARPATNVCGKCWAPLCAAHAKTHAQQSPEHHLMARYELWRYEECFWCFRCNGFALCEGFDHILEPLFTSKGSFTMRPVTDQHPEAFENRGVRVGTSTMQGWRADNEDSHVVYLGLPGTGTDFIGVYDGHGGPLVSRLVGASLHLIFDEMAKAAPAGTPVPTILTRAFVEMDERLMREQSAEECGSTGTTVNTCVINHVDKKLFCANAGDARSVLCSGGRAVDLSVDHRPTLDSERRRVLAAGSSVLDERVDGLLAVSRAMGDFDFKQASNLPADKQAVSCCPEVSTRAITAQDEFIVCACDGVWDVMTSQQVCTFVKQALLENPDPTVAVRKLLDRCVARELPEDGIGTDNMSAIVYVLPGGL